MSDKPSEEEKASPTSGQDATARTLDEDSGGPGVVRIALYAIGGGVGFIIVGFIIALIFALTNPAAAAGFQIIRDFFIIALAMEGLVIGAALVVLVLQLARLTNLLQNEIKPILDEASATAKTVKGTARFVGQNVADPVIRASGFFSWTVAFIRELLGIRRVLRQDHASSESPAEFAGGPEREGGD